MTNLIDNNSTKIAETMAPLKYVSNIWRTLETRLINCAINFILSWSKLVSYYLNCCKSRNNIFNNRHKTLCSSSSTQDNAKLCEQLKSGFKRRINWNKYQPKVSNPYLDFLIDPSFRGVNRFFVLSFENKDDRTVHKNYYLLTVEIKDYYVMIDGQNVFNQTVKNHLITYNSIRHIATSQRDDYTTGYLLDYNHYEKMRAIDLSK